jgi:hypothetical protein
LLLHAYDSDGSAPWAIPPSNRSPYAWGRAIGWVVMGLTEILDIIPENFPGRNIIAEQYKTVLKALTKYQDPGTGLWYQVIDHPYDSGNWLETSCSMMFVYAISRAVQKGILDDSYKKYVTLGYNGILTKISQDAEKMVFLKDICGGTGVSADINYYFNRPKNTNDNHGLGTFMIMNELLKYGNLPWVDSGSSPTSVETPEDARRIHDTRIFPNPVSGILTIDNENDFFKTVTVLNSAGIILFKEKMDAPVQQIDFSGYSSGLYIIELVEAGGKVIRLKVIR